MELPDWLRLGAPRPPVWRRALRGAGTAAVEEAVLRCAALWTWRGTVYAAAVQRASLRSDGDSADGAAAAAAREHLRAFCLSYTACTREAALLDPVGTGTDVTPASAAVLALGWYNAAVRLRLHDATRWPRLELYTVHRHVDPTRSAVSDSVRSELVIPPQYPEDVVPDAALWWGFGVHDAAESWIGHGRAWRAAPIQPPGDEHPLLIENAAGNAMNDYDLVECGFRRLKHARVAALDVALLRRDYAACFPAGMSDAAVRERVLRSTAWLSRGQQARLAAGGDHHTLLGVDALENGLDDVLEPTSAATAAAFRFRSGGRAATFSMEVDGCVDGALVDVKGLGTHEAADVSSPHVTGLLCLADALREMALQRLLQRLCDIEGVSATCGTVPLYGIIDTGLQYVKTNPATGWEHERCVLLLRQRQSRVLASYDAMSFSGNLPGPEATTGCGRRVREVLYRYGLSCESFPSALVADACGADDGGGAPDAPLSDATVQRLLNSGEVAAMGNLQCDAVGSRVMDTSDFYGLPCLSDAPRLPAFWRMSTAALRNAVVLGPARDAALVARSPRARCALGFDPIPDGADDAAAVVAAFHRHCDEARAALVEANPAIRASVTRWSDAPRRPLAAKPAYCMCWAMELDDSPLAKWCAATAAAVAAGTCDGAAVIADIDAQLPAFATQ